jgi:glutamine synthetase
MKPFKVEYIWLDGLNPTPQIRSKTKVIYLSDRQEAVALQDIPPWSFDGSDTNQASVENSDCLLIPAFITPDPQRSNGLIALCEVFNADGSPAQTNYRRELHGVVEATASHSPAVGLEQEYFILKDGLPPNWSTKEVQSPQGSYYCGIGIKNVSARDFVEDHLNLCLSANLPINGINAESAPGQWEFQIGGPGVNPLTTADALIVARFLLQRLGEKYGYQVTFEPKPLGSEWSGSGLHTNFSTHLMREQGGIDWIKAACQTLSDEKNIVESMMRYGDGIQFRLTGKHETSRWNEFSYSSSNRSASIRIPLPVSLAQRGFFEDRRPNANADPYRVLSFLIKTVCENEARLFSETREDK